MKLFFTKVSPYGRKVRAVAIEKGLLEKIEHIEVDLKNKSQELLDANPLGAVPTLITDDGEALYDSPVICEYLDRLVATPKLFPGGKRRFTALRIAALADAVAECAVAIVLESRRLPEQQSVQTIEKNKQALELSLRVLENDVKKLKSLSIAPIAVASALGYVSFRLIDYNWQEKNKKLARWYNNFIQRPSMQKTAPQ